MKKPIRKGVALMLLSALFTCTGQLFWKLSAGDNTILYVCLGFLFYAGGALMMIAALRFGKLSVLHPLLATGYVLSIILGAVVLNEPVSGWKIAGIAIIIAGLVLISVPEREGDGE